MVAFKINPCSNNKFKILEKILAAPKTEAEYFELQKFVEDFVVSSSLTTAGESSQYWIGLSRPEFTNDWGWPIDGTTCPIDGFGENLR